MCKGNNEVYTGAGNDKIHSRGESNSLNLLNGGDGDDEFLISGDGDNRIHGGNGNDNIDIHHAHGNHQIYGEAGDDNIRIIGNGNNRIYGGSGNDNIKMIGDGNNCIHGGSDNDTIILKGKGSNLIHGGIGDDYIQGGEGKDIIQGGDGNDVIYGMAGDDIIFGGPGNDYIDGGQGNDILKGGNGRDIISGAKGTDQIYGNSGSNVLLDNETLDSKNPNDKIYTYDSNDSEAIPTNIIIPYNHDNDTEFSARVKSDFETLKALPSFRKIIKEINKTGKQVSITQTFKAEGWANSNVDACTVKPNGTANIGADVKIGYNPSYFHNRHSGTSFPIVIFGHEMSHAYNCTTGTALWNHETAPTSGSGSIGNGKEKAIEHQAVGLPIGDTYAPITGELLKQEPVKHPDGTVSYNNPKGISENDIRADLNLAPRGASLRLNLYASSSYLNDK